MSAEDNVTPLTPPAETPAAAEPAAEFEAIGPTAAARLSGDRVQANLSAVGTVAAGSLSATGSAIGVAAVDGDATITASAVPALMSRGDLTFQQSYASAAIVSGGDAKIHQAGAPLIVGKTVDMTQSGGGVVVAGDANVKNSWVGIVLAPKATISEDSHVVVDTRAAIIIAFALFGGFGLIALAIWLSARRLARWRPINLPQLPQMPDFARLAHQLSQMPMPDVAAIQERVKHLRAS